jgi:hypothetical protein
MISSRRDLIRTTGVMLGSVSAQFDYGRTAGLGATDRNVPVLFRVGVMFQRLRRATGSSEVTVNWCPWTGVSADVSVLSGSIVPFSQF